MNPRMLERRVVEDRGYETPCWIWTGRCSPDGYGRCAGRLVHRLAYAYLVGPIPEGLQVDHLCFVRDCFNPAHLEPVTPLENTRRAFARVTECKHGHVFDEANTYIRPDNGCRQCRACTARAQREYQRRKLAAA